MITRNIWQKLSSVELEVVVIVTDFWQLFSRIFGETLLIVTHIWRNHTRFFFSVQSRYPLFEHDGNFLVLFFVGSSSSQWNELGETRRDSSISTFVSCRAHS
ncbi:MAG TPA: hypothetical protein VF043_29450 [Ktedonobacteraceae bacterium]